MSEIDVGLDLGPLEVMAGVRAELKRMNDHNAAAAEHRRREAARARVPANVRLFGSALIPTPTARTGINLGGPDPGFYWLLRRIVIGGVTWKTAAAGTAEVYVTGLTGSAGGAITGPIIAALGLNDVVDQAASLPFKDFYTSQQVIIQAQENLIVVIDTGSQAQQYSAAAQVEVWRTITAEVEYSA